MKTIKTLEKEIVPIVTKAQKVIITSTEDLTRATTMLSELNKASDTVEDTKLGITKPLNASLKATRELFKPIEDKLESAITTIRSAMTKYQTQLVWEQKIEQEKIAKRVEKGTLKVETAVKKMEELDTAVDKVVTESGSLTFMEVEKFEVVDITKLPFDYLLPNEVKIRQALKAGIKLEGVRYWTEQIPRNSR